MLYTLAIGGYEDFPFRVLEQYLELFDLCQKHNVLLLGIAKSTRSTVLGRAILNRGGSSMPSMVQQADSRQLLEADVQGEALNDDSTSGYQPRYASSGSGIYGLPSDGEVLHRWTKGGGLTDPVLLGSLSFGRASAQMATELTLRAKRSLREPQPFAIQDRIQERLSPIQEQLLAAPAIGTFYVRLSPGDDVLRVDALAKTFGRDDLHLLEFAHTLIPYTTALPIVHSDGTASSHVDILAQVVEIGIGSAVLSDNLTYDETMAILQGSYACAGYRGYPFQNERKKAVRSIFLPPRW